MPPPGMPPPGMPPPGMPPPAYQVPPSPPSASFPALLRAGLAVALVGQAITALGLFALPAQQIGRFPRSDFGFVQIREFAATTRHHFFASAFAEIWWRYALFLALAILVALLVFAVLGAAPRAIGISLAALSVVTALLQVLALAQTRDYRALFLFSFNPNHPGLSTSLLAHAGVGVWIGLAGLVVLAAGGLLIALARRPQRTP
jgi:hypothetical protein